MSSAGLADLPADLGALALALTGCNLDTAWAQYCAQHDGGCDGGSADSGTPDAGTPDEGPTGPAPTGLLAANIVLGDGVVEANIDPHPVAIADGSDAVATRSSNVGRRWAYLGDGTTAQQLIIGLYDDHQGHPHTLLASGTINGVTTKGWYTTTVSPTAVTAGSTYWIAIVAPSGTFTFLTRRESPVAAPSTASSPRSRRSPRRGPRARSIARTTRRAHRRRSFETGAESGEFGSRGGADIVWPIAMQVATSTSLVRR